MADVAAQIVQSAKVIVDAMKLVWKGNFKKEDMPLLFDGKQNSNK